MLLFLGLLCCSSLILDYTFDPVRNAYKENVMEKSRKTEQYVLAHPDNTYLYAPFVYNNISPWSVYTGKGLSNMIPWGGSAYHSDNYNRRLELNNIDDLSGEVVKRDNIYLLFNENIMGEQPADKAVLPVCFYLYLQENFDAKGFVMEEDIEQMVYVYRFVFDDNLEDFKTYYTIEQGKIVKAGDNR